MLLSLILLYCIARYDYLSGDDFLYLAGLLPVWQQTNSVLAVLQAAQEQTVQHYFEWQGNFSFIILTYLQSASFGEQYYGLTAVLTLTTLVACGLYFFRVLLHSYMRASRSVGWIISLLLTFFGGAVYV